MLSSGMAGTKCSMRLGSSRRAPACCARVGPHVYFTAATAVDSKMDVVQSMESWAASNIEPLLMPSSKAWQPQDFLPDPTADDFFDRIQAFRTECKDLPVEYLVALVGDMVTEEALPSYMSMLNRMDGCKDATGGDATSWARWNRGWTSEENRHGDLLNKLLYLCGRVNMRAIEASIQHLIGDGFDPHLGRDPYRCFVYTSFQERATKVSHRNTALQAREYGAHTLHTACETIAGDESRHEAAYQKIVDELMRRDPDAAVRAFASMMRSSIVMPAHLMRDENSQDVGAVDASSHGGNASAHESAFFKNFAALADSLGVYTARDYAEVVTHLMKRWHVHDASFVTGEGAAAQEYLVAHEQRMLRMAAVHEERCERQRRKGTRPQFDCSWVYGATAQVR